MSAEQGNTVQLPTRKALLLRTLYALIAALLVGFLFVLPAEYQIDPTGFGSLIGLDKLGQGVMTTNAAHFYGKPYRRDEVELSLPARGSYEYKVHLNKGEALLYSWVSNGVYEYDFHAHPDTGLDTKGDPSKSISYRIGNARQLHGSLIAPFTGVHGWYFKNNSDKFQEIRIKLVGQYELPKEVEDFSENLEATKK